MGDKLNLLLSANEIEPESFRALAYRALLMVLFGHLCDHLVKNREEERLLRARMRGIKNEKAVVREQLRRLCGVELDEHSLSILYRWMICFLRRTGTRQVYAEDVKLARLIAQNYLCNLCDTRLHLHTAHLDHIIPWKYVGDELEDNLQMLCRSCNLSKGGNMTFEFTNLLIRKRKADAKPQQD